MISDNIDDPHIVFRDVDKLYGSTLVLEHVALEARRGDFVSIIGPSGSGKSTLLRCISRLTDATGGKIFIEGQDLLKLNNKELINLRRNKMGMVFQSFALLPHKTVLAVSYTHLTLPTNREV